MLPTDVLRAEHRVIQQVLGCLERMAQKAQSEETLDIQSAKSAIDFFRTFADRCHHGKEEAHLFPAMEAKGFPRDGGPTGVMLYEHEQGRSHIREMDAAVDAVATGDSAALRRFIRHALAYIELLRAHIDKEDHCLFPMADQAFGESDQQQLREVFERVEREEIGEDVHQRYVALANELADRFGVERVTASAGSGGGCHSCGH
ncbi:MAG: hemerythrin [Planctomycetes bacterium]|nr:hemerythrin [Planctomycetota bacterium]